MLRCGNNLSHRLMNKDAATFIVASEPIIQSSDIQTYDVLVGFAAAQPPLRSHPARATFCFALNTSSRHQLASSPPVANHTPPACFMCRMIVRSALPRPGRPEMYGWNWNGQ